MSAGLSAWNHDWLCDRESFCYRSKKGASGYCNVALIALDNSFGITY